MQLRKCVSHPYMFNGVEPEPFELGDHLIDASGKLHLLDQLLRFLWQHNHKVLLFSQMTYMLDILQDYLGYRGYSYERLDGSVRGEERFLAVRNFNEQDETFVFLLSTKAGGQGLNLVGADTVIFVDSDFNPQNDIQAAARAHRIGQTKPVKVIRLVGRDTVEEVILRRADMKLRLTNKVIEGGQFSSIANASSTAVSATQLSDMLKFGLEKLLQSEDSTIDNVDLQGILGATVNGEWTLSEETSSESQEEQMEVDEDEDEKQDHIYMFEGKDYSKETTEEDKDAFNKLIAGIVSVAMEDQEEAVNTPRSRRQTGSSNVLPELPTSTRKRKELTEEEKEERRRKRQEAAAKRAKLQEEAEVRKSQERRRKLEELWDRNNYTSSNISLDSESDEEETGLSSDEMLGEEEDDDRRQGIRYVRGDVTHPEVKGGDSIVVHCVDDSGSWGQGGLFTALSNRSQLPETQYELAGQMKDLALGDAHLVSMDDRVSRDTGNDYVALIVAQHRDRNNTVSGIKLTALDQGLQRIYKMAKEKKGMSFNSNLARIITRKHQYLTFFVFVRFWRKCKIWCKKVFSCFDGPIVQVYYVLTFHFSQTSSRSCLSYCDPPPSLCLSIYS
ncbi:Chromodomain-helicase-DNA-binding protein 1-like [Holothuria leucospilota]|uniref:Chromodomain-helicase-DNA-binding protein 1-like n=1 Tax=Holothuria leucospilota TaxID=206669 RepID=A0A9Q0YC91_HOLLE|nr:Chromodomain-helicase-DNA-binding protein 1-like [Holothuria leucospilota]